MEKYLSASIMCADLLNLEKGLRGLEDAGIDYIHIDIMDGAFVPNITLGFDLINAIKKATKIPLDVHMMVNEPGRFIDGLNLDENDIFCVHYESDIHIHRTLEMIKNKGWRAGLAINPQTPVERMADKVTIQNRLVPSNGNTLTIWGIIADIDDKGLCQGIQAGLRQHRAPVRGRHPAGAAASGG